jgi:hypothetical protein
MTPLGDVRMALIELAFALYDEKGEVRGLFRERSAADNNAGFNQIVKSVLTLADDLGFVYILSYPANRYKMDKLV